MKKQIFFAALLSLQLHNISAQSWQTKQSGLVARHGIIDIAAPDAINAYAIAYDADNWYTNLNDITITHNKGYSWRAQAIAPLEGMRITGLGATVGNIITGNTVHVISWNPEGGGKVARSKNGGATWALEGTNTFTNTASFPDDVAFLNNNDGVMFGDAVDGYFEIYTTGNGGNNWTKVPNANIPAQIVTATQTEFGCTFVMEKFGNTFLTTTIVVNNSNNSVAYGRLLESDDKGKTWYVKNVNLPITAGDVSMKFRTKNIGLLKNNDKLYKTTDGGNTWIQVNFTGPYCQFDLDDVPGKAGWWISTGGNVGIDTTRKGSSISYDDGKTWKSIDTITHTCVEMVNYAVGYSGGISTDSKGSKGIYVYAAGLFDIIKSDEEETTIVDPIVPSTVELTVYPNPSSESFSIALNSPEARYAFIRVFNNQGIMVFSERIVAAGITSFGANLAPGAYTAEVIVDASKNTFQIVKQ